MDAKLTDSEVQTCSRLAMEFGALAQRSPNLARQLLLVLQASVPDEEPDSHESMQLLASPVADLFGQTNYEKIAGVLAQHDNRWMTVTQLRELSGLSRGPIATVLYSSHCNQFDRHVHPNHASMKLWRLTEDALKAINVAIQNRHSNFTEGELLEEDKQGNACQI
ncbi:MAG: hypothetical protein AAFY08_01125 [Planctomycetota bacterium]